MIRQGSVNCEFEQQGERLEYSKTVLGLVKMENGFIRECSVKEASKEIAA